MIRWIDECIDRFIKHGSIDIWMDGWVKDSIVVFMDRRINRLLGGWIDGWMDGWMEGLINMNFYDSMD